MCIRGRKERQCAGISGYWPENVQQELHDSKETIYPLSPRLWNQVDEALGSVWHSGQRHEHGTTSWKGYFPDTVESLEERSRIIPITSHTQLSYLHLKSSCIKILQCSKSITNNAGRGGTEKKACFNAMVFDRIWLTFLISLVWHLKNWPKSTHFEKGNHQGFSYDKFPASCFSKSVYSALCEN